jgi:hypothetical protein
LPLNFSIIFLAGVARDKKCAERTLMEKLDVAYFPVVAEWARGEPGKLLGWLGSAVKFVWCHGAPFPPFRLADPILPFWAWRWTPLDQDLCGMRCADDQPISFHMICRHCRLSEQHLDSNRGRFDAEEANGIL